MVAWKSSSTAMKTEPLPAPCPFCGSTNLDIAHLPPTELVRCATHFVRCKVCHAQGPVTAHPGPEVPTARWNDREDGDALREAHDSHS